MSSNLLFTFMHFSSHMSSSITSNDVNKDWTCKDKDKAYKHQDKDKD